MGINEKILTYLSIHRKENKYRLARALKKDVWEATKALDALEQEGKIEMKGGIAILAKGRKPIITRARKRKKQPKVEKEEPKEEPEIEPEEEQPEEAPEEQKEIEEQPEETETKEEPKEETESFEGEPEELTEEERIEGTVKFYNPNKGFGFITGADGKEYYVHESGLKQGIMIEAGDRVSFEVFQSDKDPRAEEVEKI